MSVCDVMGTVYNISFESFEIFWIYVSSTILNDLLDATWELLIIDQTFPLVDPFCGIQRSQKQVMRIFFFDVIPNKLPKKQLSWWSSETQCHACDVTVVPMFPDILIWYDAHPFIPISTKQT